jgi:4-amino-4-deoxy-L-arabinose transferase-like glycosyltransferase
MVQDQVELSETSYPDTSSISPAESRQNPRWLRHAEWIVVLVAAITFLTGVISPPSLMDDVDASQALMARNMLTSGDWVSARVDGVLFIEKAPLKYWLTAILFKTLGMHDWVARLPGALSAILLCWLVFRFGKWAFSEQAGFYAGLVLSTCVGLFLFTRIIIPDVILTLAITLSLWGFLRALDEEERHPRSWAWIMFASLAAGVLLKGLIGVVFPLGAAFLYLLFTRRLLDRQSWRRLHPFTGLFLFFAIAAPWHVLAILRNPPYFDFTMHAAPGEYRGFFWFYFINEHVLRFLNKRYPRDYNTVPALYFWLLNLVWLFPWSVFLPRLIRLRYKPEDRAGRVRMMTLCWIAFVMVFFSFSTTQEYYSMPIYPAVALLLGCAIAAATDQGIRLATKFVAVVAAFAALAITGILFMVRGVPTPGDISLALTQNPDAYTLSMGHIGDLTVRAFAYLRLPLVVAGIAFAIGALGSWFLRGRKSLFALAAMMVIFFQAARLALIVFDPYLSSKPVAEVLNRSPKGQLIIYGEHNEISSLFFYGKDNSLILDGRDINLEYGSYAPNAPDVFITDADFPRLWGQPQLYYLALHDDVIPKVEKLVQRSELHLVASIGGKSLYSNQPVSSDSTAAGDH